jgi:hypothetical protein
LDRASWQEDQPNNVKRTDKDGRGDTIDMFRGTDAPLADFLYGANRLAVDDEHVYWASWGGTGITGQISRRRKNRGASAETVARAGDRPCGLTVDGDLVVWGAWSSSTDDPDGVKYQRKSDIGVLASQAGTVVPGATGTCAVALADGAIWWESTTGELWGPYTPGNAALAANFAGSPEPQTPPVEEPWRRRNLQLVDDTWYWGAGSRVTSVSRSSGPPTDDITKTIEANVAKLLVDDESIYFMQMSEDTSKPVHLLRHGRTTGGDPEEVSSDEVQAMAQDADFVYFAWRNGIYRVEK